MVKNRNSFLPRLFSYFIYNTILVPILRVSLFGSFYSLLIHVLLLGSTR